MRYWVNSARSEPAELLLPSASCSAESDSSMVRRIHSTTSAPSPPMANGMRQPQSRTWSSLRNPNMIRSVSWASTCPPISVTYWKDEKKPRRSRVAASDM